MKRSDITDQLALGLVERWKQEGLGGSPVQALQQQGFPFKVVLRKLEQLADRGLIDYGVSLNYPWLTDEGRAALVPTP